MELNFALTSDTLWLFAYEYNDELHNIWDVLIIYEEFVVCYILEFKIVWFVSISSLIYINRKIADVSYCFGY